MKHITISDDSDVFTDAYIYIHPTVTPKHGTMKYQLLYRFMTELNQLIGAKTPMNYHTRKVIMDPIPTITIPIYVYSNEDKLIEPEELVKKRLDTLRSYFEKLDINTTSRNMLWTVRSMTIMKYPLEFILSTSTPNIEAFNDITNEPIHITIPELEYPTIHRDKSQNGDLITYLVDPYVTDYGLFVNLTTSFNDMGMSYNILHLYEHLMTKGWENLPGKDLLEMNGSTFPHGLCYVYTIHSSEESLKLYTEKYLDYYLQSRKPGFWNEDIPKEQLKTETQRTISETRTDRTLITMGRSDYKAYDFKYDTNIFTYWSNRPYELLIVSPKKIKLNLKTTKTHNIKRPNNITFNMMPLDVMKMKKLQGFSIKKASSKDVKQLIAKPDAEYTCGLDCTFSADNEDLSVYTSVLHPLLYCNILFSNEELKQFIKTRILPWSCKLYADASITKPYVSLWLNELPNEDDY